LAGCPDPESNNDNIKELTYFLSEISKIKPLANSLALDEKLHYIILVMIWHQHTFVFLITQSNAQQYYRIHLFMIDNSDGGSPHPHQGCSVLAMRSDKRVRCRS
jgi:hypothetical protein